MTLAHLRGQRQLRRRQLERAARRLAVDTLHLEEHATGLHDRDPHLGRPLALAHAGFGRLLGERLVGEHAHPDASATLDGARERHASGLDLTRREPAAIDDLQTVVAERERRATPRRSAAATLLLLAILDLLRCEHDDPELSAGGGALLLLFPAQHLAAEDPDAHPDDAVGGPGLGEAVIHVGPQRVQGDAPLAVPLRARDLRAAEPACRLDADALRAHAHGAGERFLHGAPEGHPAFELQRHVLGHQLRVDVGTPHLVDVDEGLLAREAGELLLELLDLRALLADHDTGTGGVDVDLRLVRGALDVDLRDARVVQAFLQEVADLDVLVQELGIFPPRKPARIPVLRDPQAEPLRMNLLSHGQASPPLRRSSTTTVMWLLRLNTGVARPCARGVKRLAVGPSSTQARLT